MKLSDFVGKGQVKKSSKNISLAKSLLVTAENDLRFLNGLEINETSARKIMSNYYDILRSILEAVSALDGYKIYSHEAFAYYLIEINEDILSSKFDRFRKIRNKINYYGKDILVGEVKENVREILIMINELKEKYLKSI